MNAATERLIALQDLLLLKRDLADATYEEIGFETGGVDAVDSEIDSLKAEIDPRVLRRYETLSGRYERPLVPARKGTCYGCFVRFPTARESEVTDEPRSCENCGRLLYEVS